MKNEFRIRAVDALADTELRHNFRGAMDFLQSKRASAFANTDLNALRNEGAAIRRSVLEQLPELLEQLEESCRQKGIQVHWARNAQHARTIIGDIAQTNHVKHVVKGKSMATEEIELNQHLESLGVQCIESDMGEYIVQLDHETPSHIIMPAIHKSKEQIARLFTRELNENTEDASVDDLIGIGRKALRQQFKDADMGVSGVNFAIAETGSLCLVENEGNGRMSTGIPRIHVALMGIEKVVPSFKEIPPLLTLLTGSATGQLITTYFNIINSPRKADEIDGPEQVHLVLLDNGRSEMYMDDHLSETLACIRCGACMNHCPVYTRIGGHAYGSTYPGPIGQVVMPQIEGLSEKGDLLDACSLNGACGEACPVNIPLPNLIRSLREKRLEPNKIERFGWKVWALLYRNIYLHSLLSFGAKLAHYLPFPKPASWTSTRTFPKPATASFSELMRARKND
ncbi:MULTISPECIES: LutB/LldF family L-lactate oxidation iron-sulfur protein [unclassified Oleiphilus]|uniref:LutB/LldF family L-lactate oxidation iron-sulfur protein n=1 Tax=unclassified Oleiphilus TaxID=2631174 RepID=UPI0009EE52AC|nr:MULTISPECIES: LutB/LldF family L-lactate oxidation iron-sulfur protein [unclassified Oleiphilus]